MQAAALVERSDHQGPAGSGVSYWQVRVGAWVNLPGRAFKCLGSPESARALLRVSAPWSAPNFNLSRVARRRLSESAPDWSQARVARVSFRCQWALSQVTRLGVSLSRLRAYSWVARVRARFPSRVSLGFVSGPCGPSRRPSLGARCRPELLCRLHLRALTGREELE